MVIARFMLRAGFKVRTFILNLNQQFSSDFEVNRKRLEEMPKAEIEVWNDFPEEFPVFAEKTIMVDAIFGSGLSRELKSWPAKIIKQLNELPYIKVAIDIPSGLFADKALEAKIPIAFRADYTLSFQFPKLAFLFPENDAFVGHWKILDIGLSSAYIQQTETAHYFLNKAFVRSLIKRREKFSHKGDYGHLLMIAGDHTKMGAALLSSKAALRAGASLVSLHHPKNSALYLSAVPEIMSSPDENEACFSQVPPLDKYSQIAIGPGLGLHKKTINAFKILIQQAQSPLVIDADALNILAENKTWLNFLPKASVLTPHIGELRRLIGNSNNSFHQLEKTKAFAKKYQLYVLIKGAHSAVCTPNGQVFFNSTGNPGMASGGSGDVLTGIIAALMAQHYSSLDAAIIGMYLHGLSGDLALEKNSVQSLIASDIVDYLGLAEKYLSS
ncbi:MAG: NAD(P)H-hydrate dehydratase [Bacteroidetes bacterium 4572_77]|nr:MAG: NAD(P)H-hydrate dehydratase [Bacteroidetes bacterium 4572_77]